MPSVPGLDPGCPMRRKGQRRRSGSSSQATQDRLHEMSAAGPDLPLERYRQAPEGCTPVAWAGPTRRRSGLATSAAPPSPAPLIPGSERVPVANPALGRPPPQSGSYSRRMGNPCLIPSINWVRASQLAPQEPQLHGRREVLVREPML